MQNRREEEGKCAQFMWFKPDQHGPKQFTDWFMTRIDCQTVPCIFTVGTGNPTDEAQQQTPNVINTYKFLNVFT